MTKYEHWSSLAPLPFEIVISAGQKAKEEFSQKGKFLFGDCELFIDLPAIAHPQLLAHFFFGGCVI